ncbi:MAG: alpha-galactosidase [Saprospiraceae bacterium]|jgi:alpha-galactosidase
MTFLTTLTYNDKTVTLVPGKMTFFEELYVDYKIESKLNSSRIQLMIHPKEQIVLKALKLVRKRSFASEEKVFCNGFQSWSESREYSLKEKIPSLKNFARPYLKYYGDAYFDFIKRGKGYFHSWTYGYIKKGKKIDFVGSLTESTAFTLIQYDTRLGEICIEKECDGLVLEHSFPILDIFIAEGNESWVFNEYFNAMGLSPPKVPPLTGWTSSYNYSSNISEEIILKNAAAFVAKEIPIDSIHIDEGYQRYIGDWLNIKDTFPNGMAHVARQIKSKGFKAGIWVAPFVCETKSDIFQHKKHWLVKGQSGKLIRAGYNPRWGGWFYALDYYQKEVQDYLLGVFKTVFEKWGYDLVKLDFLYVACIQPPPNKTRGQMMNEALQFLRTTIGNNMILASGVPLGSAFGKVDYCRIGTDINLKWENSFFKFLSHRERISSILALRSTLGRWQLNGKFFHSDPGVILLRDSNIRLSPAQQFTILIINTLLGNLLFTTDSVGDYSDEQWAEFLNIYHWRNSEIKAVEAQGNDIYLIRFRKENRNWVCVCNLTGKETRVLIGKLAILLEAFESMVLEDGVSV